MLHDPEWATWSDRAIAKACAVDHKSVAKVRRELTAPKRGEIPTRSRGNGAIDAAGSSGEIPIPSSMAERMLATVSNAALIAECHRRGLVVRDA